LADGLQTFYATGHRKNATAKVWLVPGGTGNFTVNGRSMPDYLQRRSLELIVMQPLRLVDAEAQFDIKAKVLGGGISGQAGALRHGISKALIVANPDLRPPLRRGGYLTRDPRVKERKKYGRKGARRGFQFSKR
jgi:small subunit ribosomal protein S9